MNKFLMSLILIVAFCSPAFAVDGDLFGVESNAGQEVRIDENAVLVGLKANVEVIATNDTLTAAESGKIVVVDQATDVTTGTVTITLPTAVKGLTFTVISADDETIYVDPASTDTIVSETVPMAAGDKLASPSATGDSVTLVGSADNTWVLIEHSGTWTDGN